MSLNISKGNMYEFITHTWNTIKCECNHDCSCDNCFYGRTKLANELLKYVEV